MTEKVHKQHRRSLASAKGVAGTGGPTKAHLDHLAKGSGHANARGHGIASNPGKRLALRKGSLHQGS